MITHYPKDWIARASAHYAHAVEKHPHFCDQLIPKENPPCDCEACLDAARARIRKRSEEGCVDALALLDCEVSEAIVEIAKGDAERAVEEIYDAVAVLMRMADMVERGVDTLSSTTLSGAKEGE